MGASGLSTKTGRSTGFSFQEAPQKGVESPGVSFQTTPKVALTTIKPLRRWPEVAQTRKPRPATTPEDRENQMIAYAVDLAEKQLRAGTASSQVITHFLKLGSTREQLEKTRIEQENLLIKAKIEALESSKNVAELYGEALKAMRTYSGNG